MRGSRLRRSRVVRRRRLVSRATVRPLRFFLLVVVPVLVLVVFLVLLFVLFFRFRGLRRFLAVGFGVVVLLPTRPS